MMKIKKINIILKLAGIVIMGLLCICGCNTTKKQINKDYPQLIDQKHVFESIEVNEVKNMFDNHNDFYLVMGFSDCPWCQALIPILNEVAKENQVKIVYYLDIKEIRDNEKATGYDIFSDLTNTVFKAIIDQEKNRVNAPTFIKVEKGEIVGYHLNTVSGHVKNDSGYLPPLTEEQVLELKEILNHIFQTNS